MSGFCLTVHSQSFADVPITDDGVDTETFLQASDGLVQMFGEKIVYDFANSPTNAATTTELLGSGVFGFVQNDIRSNVAVCQERPACLLFRLQLYRESASASKPRAKIQRRSNNS
jgi:hypothetical protein